MPRILRFDHVGITVENLENAVDFFVGLGLEVQGSTFVEGDFINTVTALPNARSEIVMLRIPGGDTAVELSSFVRPAHLGGSPQNMANELGIRSLSFEVDDLQGQVERLKSQGYALVGGVGEYEGSWKMGYIRGPEGILVALAQRLG
ncbi:VOC family protein [Glutamicibacter sp.]|uniref:VOC family protein n=1 Tax=Glutamicibacter sp. TaxID=1931995 RepID=UPI002B4870A5|nr:VOC family protein [Glutamicibacter sp.]HJX77448.1 VOC family protein [Glutamicibacter sp.]